MTEVADQERQAPLVRAAWWSVLLGFCLGLVPFVGDLMTNARSGGALAASLAQGLIWSVVICVSLAAGARRAVKLAYVGLLVAPVAALLGSLLHEVVENALVSTADQVESPAPLLLAALRGVEYGVLGLLLGKVRKRPARTWASRGLLVGVGFGSVVLAMWQFAGPLDPPDLVAQAVNEFFFPAGCSLVVKDAVSS
jgi:hypothetical protein